MKGLELKRKRESLGYTQEEVAKLLGKSKRTVISWEQSEELTQGQVLQVHSIFNKSETIAQSEVLSLDDNERLKDKDKIIRLLEENKSLESKIDNLKEIVLANLVSLDELKDMCAIYFNKVK